MSKSLRKFVAFDIETTHVTNEKLDDVNITVAVTETSDGEVLCWTSWMPSQNPETVSNTCPLTENDLKTKAAAYFCEYVESPEKPLIAQPSLTDDDVVNFFHIEKKHSKGINFDTEWCSF